MNFEQVKILRKNKKNSTVKKKGYESKEKNTENKFFKLPNKIWVF